MHAVAESRSHTARSMSLVEPWPWDIRLVWGGARRRSLEPYTTCSNKNKTGCCDWMRVHLQWRWWCVGHYHWANELSYSFVERGQAGLRCIDQRVLYFRLMRGRMMRCEVFISTSVSYDLACLTTSKMEIKWKNNERQNLNRTILEKENIAIYL